MSQVWVYLEPLDVLYLRGNNLFGGPGDHAEALMPPWPSVFAGALRSALLARAGVDLGRFTDEGAVHTNKDYEKVLGTPTQPGEFRVSAVLLCRAGEGAELQPIFPLPADLAVFKASPGSSGEGHSSRCAPCSTHEPPHPKEGSERRGGDGPPVEVRRLRPALCSGALAHVRHNGPTGTLPVLVRDKEGKPESGFWLTAEGWKAYVAGGTPSPEHLVKRSDLWDHDFRLGIARSRETYTVEAGRIYTTQTVAMKPGIGFLVGVEGCPADLFSGVNVVRLGGDGRGARLEVKEPPEIPRAQPSEGRLALVLLTPGLFPQGWLLPGVRKADGEYRVACDGFSARLACAVVPRAQVVSGWDLPAHKPKPAQRTVPSGSVYYLDEVEGDVSRYLDRLWDLICDELPQRGEKDAYDTVWQQRKAEGFNNFLVAQWPKIT